jgi:plastocyanin
VAGFHQIAVYKAPPGTTRQNVTANPATYLDATINDPAYKRDIGDPKNRVAIGASPWDMDTAAVNQDHALGTDVTITPPGRYLVICAIRSHFLDKDPAANGGMFGFIDVASPVQGHSDASLASPVGYPADVTVRFGDPRFLTSGDARNYGILPSTVQVATGETVRFESAGAHQVAVYKVPPDTTRQAVTNNPNAFLNTAINSPFSNNDIGDPKNRIALGSSSRRTADRAVVNPDDALRVDVTITQPGRYLAICAVRSHFLEKDPAANGGMFGFIDVR